MKRFSLQNVCLFGMWLSDWERKKHIKKETRTILFEIITCLVRKPLNHVTVLAENAWEFLRGIIPSNSILQENKQTVTVTRINSKGL